MEKKSVVVIGYGDRGSIYADFAATHPDEMEIKVVVDPNPFRLSLAKEKFNLKDDQLMTSFEEFCKLGKVADGAILATMDELHYSQGKALLNLGYHMLIEKPVVNNAPQLDELRDLAVSKGLIMMVGHVLRYTPFYLSIKNALLRGEIGEIINIETAEYVGICHTSSSFGRGKWNNSVKCGSPFLLAKCCHDLDLICWLNIDAKPVEVVSFGDRTNVVPSRAPKESSDKCYTCPLLDTCIYSAKSLYVLNDMFPHYSFAGFKKKHNEITLEEKEAALRGDDPFGVCIYKTVTDLIDHQAVLIKFDNGSIANHTLVSYVPRPGRRIQIIGTKGEIEGFFEEGTYTIRKQDYATSFYKKEIVDVNKEIQEGVGHGGGDIGIITDFVKRLRNEKPSVSSTDIDKSIFSHKLCYYAHESMTEDKIVKYK